MVKRKKKLKSSSSINRTYVGDDDLDFNPRKKSVQNKIKAINDECDMKNNALEINIPNNI